MYSPYSPDPEKHFVIEQLLDNIELAMESKLFFRACSDSGFMNHNKQFMDLADHSNQLTDENILAFNAISKQISGIPIKLTEQESDQNAFIYELGRIENYNWVFEGQNESMMPFKITYTSISQLRDAYRASLNLG